MFPRTARRLALAALLLVGLAACSPHGPNAPTPSIRLEPCHLAAPGSPDRVAARCGTLTVFEDRAARSGRTLDLHIAVVPATSAAPAPDPIVFLTGGPGQAATESYPLLAPAFARLNRTRDVVLVDQRGTGRSNGLRCPDPDLDTPTDPGALRERAAGCAAELAPRADLRLYTTPIAMDDLDAVRAALGYERVNLYGVSYGTRAALAYLRQHPTRVRAAILDGVAPPDWLLGPAIAADAQRSLNLLFARCAGEEACRAAYPDPRGELDALLADLAREPVRARFAHPVSGVPTELLLTRETVVGVVRLLSYAPETAALLPLLIHQGRADGNLGPLAAQALLVGEDVGRVINEGLHNSVVCAEDVPYFQDMRAVDGAATYLGDLLTSGLEEVCAAWPRGMIPADYREPVRSDVPVLLLSGEADLVTPPANGERAARTLPNARHVVVPGAGHNVLPRGCVPRLATAFIERASAADIDTACVETLRPAAIFTSPAGPQP